MRPITRRLAAGIWLLLGVPLTALGQSGFALFDADRSGLLDRHEFDARMAAEAQSSASAGAGARGDDGTSVFRRLDADGNGFLSDAELAAPAATNASWIASDRDRDGRISPAEFRALAGR